MNLSKETLQTAIEAIETYQAQFVSKMGTTEKQRFARCLLQLRDAIIVLEKGGSS